VKNDYRYGLVAALSILVVTVHILSLTEFRYLKNILGIILITTPFISIFCLLYYFLLIRKEKGSLLKGKPDYRGTIRQFGIRGQFEGQDGMEQTLNLLGSVASIASLIMQGLVIVEEEGKRRRLIPVNAEVAELPEFVLVHEEPSATNAAITLSETVIDQEVLDAFHERLKKHREEFADRIKRANAAQGLDAIQAKATREICDVLNRIRALNGGKLPGALFEKMWKSYKCRKSY